MAELPPINPSGAVPPPKKETGKVQPKKETVRINLPPKPSAAPTIKLPTLPPGGPTGAPSAPVAAAAPAAAPRAAAAPAAALARPTAAPAPTAPTAQPRPVAAAHAAPLVPALKGLDKGLIYTAAALSLVAVGIVVWVFMAAKSSIENFTT